MSGHFTTAEIAEAIYIVNRHAKSALKPRHLYTLKRKAIEKLLHEKKAKKIGLHFSNNPKLSNQHSTLLIKVDRYYFHTLPSKDDFKYLPHLGELDDSNRNPRVQLSLSRAKHILYNYLNWKQHRRRRKEKSPYYIPSSLGKMEWSPTKKL